MSSARLLSLCCTQTSIMPIQCLVLSILDDVKTLAQFSKTALH